MLLLLLVLFACVMERHWSGMVVAFVPPFSASGKSAVTTTATASRATALQATTAASKAARRHTHNAEGPLYVNDSCINCSACSMFAPSVFSREADDTTHIVSKQPASDREIEQARAAMVACPVAAIKVEKPPLSGSTTNNVSNNSNSIYQIHPKLQSKDERPFPRPVSPNLPGVYFVGHHNRKSFGAAPYLLSTTTMGSSEEKDDDNDDGNDKGSSTQWILVDTPKYSKAAVEAVESLTGPDGPSSLVLTHVDDTADHNRWKNHYPHLKRIFHAGDLGEHNWIGDETLEDVEILLRECSSTTQLQHFDMQGTPVDSDSNDSIVLVHTPGHSPGSIALLMRPTAESPGTLFSGDTYSYTTREGGHMSGFPRFGNDPRLQSEILPRLLDLEWKILAPGHGHVRDYTLLQGGHHDLRDVEMEEAIKELSLYF